MITCYINYEINPAKTAEFEKYAKMWIPLVGKFGGVHHGYYLPHESPSDLAVCLFSFPSLAAYETYRAKSMQDNACRKAIAFAEETECIRRYDRHFLRPVTSDT
ncbi:MAG: NIPSNAP family protein [Pseudomonadota bacterium]